MYHWVHSINNASLVVAALLSSKGDYETAICNVVMGGWDTDSNGATVGSIMGTMLGADKLPSKWISPLQNKIRSSLKGFDNSLLSDLAKRTTATAQFSPL
jgi:ADP-ribosylglycohydrolase